MTLMAEIRHFFERKTDNPQTADLTGTPAEDLARFVRGDDVPQTPLPSAAVAAAETYAAATGVKPRHLTRENDSPTAAAEQSLASANLVAVSDVRQDGQECISDPLEHLTVSQHCDYKQTAESIQNLSESVDRIQRIAEETPRLMNVALDAIRRDITELILSQSELTGSLNELRRMVVEHHSSNVVQSAHFHSWFIRAAIVGGVTFAIAVTALIVSIAL